MISTRLVQIDQSDPQRLDGFGQSGNMDFRRGFAAFVFLGPLEIKLQI
jgi:hypothetical protein